MKIEVARNRSKILLAAKAACLPPGRFRCRLARGSSGCCSVARAGAVAQPASIEGNGNIISYTVCAPQRRLCRCEQRNLVFARLRSHSGCAQARNIRLLAQPQQLRAGQELAAEALPTFIQVARNRSQNLLAAKAVCLPPGSFRCRLGRSSASAVGQVASVEGTVWLATASKGHCPGTDTRSM